MMRHAHEHREGFKALVYKSDEKVSASMSFTGDRVLMSTFCLYAAQYRCHIGDLVD